MRGHSRLAGLIGGRVAMAAAVGILVITIPHADAQGAPSMSAVPSTTTYATTHVCGSRVCP